MGGTHTVLKGESFASIAGLAFGDQRMFAEVQKANPGINVLRPGQVIKLPDKVNNPYISNETMAAAIAFDTQMGWRAGTTPPTVKALQQQPQNVPAVKLPQSFEKTPEEIQREQTIKGVTYNAIGQTLKPVVPEPVEKYQMPVFQGTGSVTPSSQNYTMFKPTGGGTINTSPQAAQWAEENFYLPDFKKLFFWQPFATNVIKTGPGQGQFLRPSWGWWNKNQNTFPSNYQGGYPGSPRGQKMMLSQTVDQFKANPPAGFDPQYQAYSPNVLSPSSIFRFYFSRLGPNPFWGLFNWGT